MREYVCACVSECAYMCSLQEVTAAAFLSIIINLCARELVRLSVCLSASLCVCASVCVRLCASISVLRFAMLLFIYLFFGLRHFTAICWANSAYACYAALNSALCPVMLWLFALSCSVNCAYELGYKS